MVVYECLNTYGGDQRFLDVHDRSHSFPCGLCWPRLKILEWSHAERTRWHCCCISALFVCVVCVRACMCTHKGSVWHDGGGGEAVFTPNNLPRLWFKMIQMPCMRRDSVGWLLVQDWERLGLPKWSPPEYTGRYEKKYSSATTSHSRAYLSIPLFFVVLIDQAHACVLAVTLYAE